MTNNRLIGVDLDTDRKDEFLEQLFSDLFEAFNETGFSQVNEEEVDALEQSQLGNGTWGVIMNADSEKGIWTMAEGGTFIAWENGNTDSIDFDWTDESYEVEPNPEDPYHLIYHVLNKLLPDGTMPDLLVRDDVEEEAQRLADSVDTEEEDDDQQ